MRPYRFLGLLMILGVYIATAKLRLPTALLRLASFDSAPFDNAQAVL